MTEPTKKAPEIDNLITKTLGIDRVGSIKSDICAWCKQPATEFKDELSVKEYKISGLCQKCQDETFG